MAIFEEEPDELEEDPGLEAPPAPWEYEPELPPEIEQGENRPVPEVSEYEEPPQPKVPPEDKYGPPPQILSEEPERPWPQGPAYPGERPYPEPPPPKRPVDPNDWTQSERALQEKWIAQTNPGPLPPPYSTYYGPAGEQYGFFPQQPGIPESMFQQGKGWTPTPQFQETTTFTPDGYAETTTSPSNWTVPQVMGPKMPAQLLDKKFAQMDGQWYDPKSGRWMQPDSTARDASGNRDLEYSKYDKTLDYMYDEMMRNVNSRQVKSIQELLDFTGNPSLARYGNSALYFTAAMSEWASMVGTGQEWDHKPKLDSMLGLREANDYYFPIRGDTEHKYYYNIWSNIHYGYVGSAAGFDAETLHRGGDSMIPFTPIKYDPTSAISIQIGIDLWNQKGTGLRPEDIQQAILAHTQDYMRYRPEFETVVPRKRGR